MNRNNFLGLNGFVWWVGEVEDVNDPLASARCRVRIFGWHTKEKSVLPTEQLPWALPMYPINSSTTFESPKLTQWVVGFFMDGESGQMPVMMGLLPGINNN
jgi:hypothetical protein